MAGGHALTRVGDNFNRRHYYRRDTNCSGFLLYKPDRRSKKLEKIAARVINLSEHDVLLLVDKLDLRLFEAYVVLPGIRAKIAGKVVRQGDYVVALEFEVLIPSAVVDAIAAIEAPANPA